jgi:hypothetical protein
VYEGSPRMKYITALVKIVTPISIPASTEKSIGVYL